MICSEARAMGSEFPSASSLATSFDTCQNFERSSPSFRSLTSSVMMVVLVMVFLLICDRDYRGLHEAGLQLVRRERHRRPQHCGGASAYRPNEQLQDAD